MHHLTTGARRIDSSRRIEAERERERRLRDESAALISLILTLASFADIRREGEGERDGEIFHRSTI